MRSMRFYHDIDITSGGRIELTESAAHHARDVLWLREGDRITLFNDGSEFVATIVQIGKRGVSVEIGAAIQPLPESPLRVVLGQAISAGVKMDFTLQKAVELGVHAVQPLASERSVVKLSAERAEKRLAHWQGVAIAAAEQSGRSHVPPVAPIQPLRDWLASKPADALAITLAPDAHTRFVELKPQGNYILLLIGPEGGFSEAEIAAAVAAGFTSATLGPRILRTETAALTALAVIQALWGDF